MAIKNCSKCKNCVLRPIKNQCEVVTVCKLEDRIAKLSLEQLAVRFSSNTCDWFEPGVPERSNIPCYED